MLRVLASGVSAASGDICCTELISANPLFIREQNVITNLDQKCNAEKRKITSAISHELVHLWFGDLLTMQWWDELWLSEAFASFLEFKGAEFAEPELELEAEFLNRHIHDSMEVDALENSHPILAEEAINNTGQIADLYDCITSGKGASVLRMLERFMGKDDFKLGVQKFLDSYAFLTATTGECYVYYTV